MADSASGISRRQFLRSAGAALAAGAAANVLSRVAWAQQSQPAAKPNIVFILADDLGIEGLGCFGSQAYSTPNLDGLAAAGIRFTRGYVNPLCSPTRVAVMTGRYNCRNYHGWGVFDPTKEKTFGHVLKEAGYATALAGKWQFDDFSKHPNHVRDSGFDEYLAWIWHGTERYWNPGLWSNGRKVQDTQGKYGPDLECEFLIDFIRRHKQGPFLAYWPMTLVHAPHLPTPDMTGGLAPAAKVKATSQPAEDKEDAKKIKAAQAGRVFPGMVAYMDKLIGKLLAAIDELGLRDNTLIIFVGDNGMARGINSRYQDKAIPGGKGMMRDTGSHVPLIASWRGRTPGGKACEDLVDASDYFATILDAAGAQAPKDRTVDGRSFLPQACGQKGNPRQWALVELGPERFLMEKRYKLRQDGRLFDLQNAPFQEPEVPEGAITGEARAAKAQLEKVFSELPPALTIGGGPNDKGDG